MIHARNDEPDSSAAAVRLERLAAFAPNFRDPGAVFGNHPPDTGTGTRDDPIRLNSFELSEFGTRFFSMVYDAGWIIRGFDWPAWIRTEEGRLATDRAALGTATCDQLAKLLTAVVRQDRFYDGALEDAFESGLLRAIAERAEVLASEIDQQ